MSAGMVGVPAIVPLKMPGFGATGSRKWSVDTKTLIEMHSSTKGCIVFFTLDGTKPDPFKKIGDKTTYQYTKPITLPRGKRTLKAIAMLKDGSRESNVNTKVFTVTEAPVEEEEEKNDKFNTTWQCQDDSEDEEKIDQKMFKKVMRTSEERAPQEKKDPVRKILTGEVDVDKNDTRFQDIREEEYLMCVYCGEPRPADPYARFCNGCKSILPPAPGRIRSSYGNSFANAMIKSSSKQKIECKNCGTTNLSNAEVCLVCDSPMMNGVSKSKLKNQKAPEPANDFIICPYCTRVNCGNARYCDWCGERSNSKSRTAVCQRCSTENLVSSQYCSSCGKNLPAPQRDSLEKILEKGDLKIKTGNKTSKGQLGLLEKLTEGEEQSGSWKSIEFESVNRKESKNIGIQAGESIIPSMQKSSLKDHPKNSPGKGYWRQQTDYVSQHLKIYTQNNIDFREQFSNQTLSNLVSCSLEDDEEERLKHLTLSFSIPESSKKSQKKGKKHQTINSGETLINALKKSSISGSRPSSGRSRPASGRSFTKQSTRDDFDSPRSQNGSRPSSGRKPKTKKTLDKEKLDAFYAKLSEDTKELLKLIKSPKTPNLETVELLLDSEDIDVNVRDENGIPLLKLAIMNKHFDILLSLILSDVDINAVSGAKNDTALHEAVLMGVMGKDAVEILLENDAAFDILDKKGQSAHDLAVTLNVDAVLAIFSQHTSKGLLNDVMKL
ncbi:double zinc ribbon and ankyrin repeat-containing protein 1-like [Clytia hemisphaerica]|uniref:double zinc ribbon and ankyrin repeat-containing protein 1-like n=1 Tax=Clytia hemisphaerica TaxID=252671 RepID=UPI0034D71F95